MDTTYFINNDTGELLTGEQAVREWHDNFDGSDNTNIITFFMQYTAKILLKDKPFSPC